MSNEKIPNMLMLVDANKLTNETIEMIANGYGYFYNHSEYNDETYEHFIDSVVFALCCNTMVFNGMGDAHEVDISVNDGEIKEVVLNDIQC